MMSARTFRAIAVLESCTWSALILAVVLKYGAGLGVATKIMGPVHGIAFLVYFCAVLAEREEWGLSLKHAAVLIGAALIPFGAAFAERRLLGDRAGGGAEVDAPAVTPAR